MDRPYSLSMKSDDRAHESSTIRPKSVWAYRVEHEQFIGNGHLIGSSLRRTAYFFALICNRTGHAFSKSATGKTDVSFNV